MTSSNIVVMFVGLTVAYLSASSVSTKSNLVKPDFKAASCNILMQQNFANSYFFDKTWDELLVESGTPSETYWLGLQNLRELTMNGGYRLRIDMQAQDGSLYWEEYATVTFGESFNFYRITVTGYSGNTGSYGCLYNHNNWGFSTVDLDIYGCSKTYLSGWWYNTNNCITTCLNCSPYPYFRFSTPELGDVYLQSTSMRLICANSTSVHN